MDYEEDDSLYHECVAEATVFNQPLYSRDLGDKRVSYHVVNARELIPHVASWIFNRLESAEHTNQIVKDLMAKDVSAAHLMGSIQIVRDGKNSFHVINGQHRISALRQIIKNDIDMKFDMPLMVEVYTMNNIDLEQIVEDKETSDTINSLMTLANTSKPFEPINDHTSYCRKLVAKLEKEYPDCIVRKTEGTVHKPRILARSLYEMFMKDMPSYIISVVDVNGMAKRIQTLNSKLVGCDVMEIFNRPRHRVSEDKIKRWEKALSKKFMLNIDGNYTPEKWMKIVTSSDYPEIIRQI
jgi:hypothetical protein